MTRSKRFLTAACAAALLAPAGAALAGDAAAQAGQKPAPAAAQQTDDQLAMQVERQLHSQPGLEDVKAESKQGVVTLKGQVASATQKSRAEQIAKATSGVSRVQNQIEIES